MKFLLEVNKLIIVVVPRMSNVVEWTYVWPSRIAEKGGRDAE